MTTAHEEAVPALVDTDVATWLLLDAEHAQAWKPILRGRLIAISFATYGELLALPASRSWGEKRTREWDGAIRRTFVVLPYSADVARIWGPLHAKLRGHLHNGGTNDIWTAATALASDHRLPVATNNLSDFEAIAGETALVVLHPSR
jgi:predicted nucleic acid-binding protein